MEVHAMPCWNCRKRDIVYWQSFHTYRAFLSRNKLMHFVRKRLRNSIIMCASVRRNCLNPIYEGYGAGGLVSRF